MNKKIKILLSIIISIFVIVLTNGVYAASANLSATYTNLEPGQSTSITVSVSATEAWNLKLSSNGGNLSGNLESADAMGSEVSQNVITASFSSSSEGSYVITLSGQITGSDLVKQPVSKSITINVKAKESVVTPDPEPDPVPEQKPNPEPEQKDPDPAPTTKSSVAILSDLGIRPKEYDFSGFSKNRNKEEWHVTVPNEVTRIEVYATAGENGKVISGTGWKNLKDIRTPFEVVVQSEDGTKTKTYTIYVTREVEEGEIIPNTNENTDENASDDITVGLSKLEVTGLTYTPEFSTNEYKYTIEGKLEDFGSVEEFKQLIKAEANFEGAKIEITSEEEEFKVGRNKILITVKDSDGREIAIYTIVLKLTEKEEAVVGKVEDDNKDKKEKSNIDWNKVILISSIVLMSICAISVSSIAYKQRKILEENGLIKLDRYEEDEDPFEEMKSEKIINSTEEIVHENIKAEVKEESEEEIRKRKIDEFLRGRESKH